MEKMINPWILIFMLVCTALTVWCDDNNARDSAVKRRSNSNSRSATWMGSRDDYSNIKRGVRARPRDRRDVEYQACFVTKAGSYSYGSSTGKPKLIPANNQNYMWHNFRTFNVKLEAGKCDCASVMGPYVDPFNMIGLALDSIYVGDDWSAEAVYVKQGNVEKTCRVSDENCGDPCWIYRHEVKKGRKSNHKEIECSNGWNNIPSNCPTHKLG